MRMDSTWRIAKENMNKAQERMKKYKDRRCRLINFEEGDRVLLSMQNLSFKNIPSKLRQRFVGPFRIEEKISAKETAELYWNKVVCLHGMPRAIHSD